MFLTVLYCIFLGVIGSDCFLKKRMKEKPLQGENLINCSYYIFWIHNSKLTGWHDYTSVHSYHYLIANS